MDYLSKKTKPQYRHKMINTTITSLSLSLTHTHTHTILTCNMQKSIFSFMDAKSTKEQKTAKKKL